MAVFLALLVVMQLVFYLFPDFQCEVNMAFFDSYLSKALLFSWQEEGQKTKGGLSSTKLLDEICFISSSCCSYSFLSHISHEHQRIEIDIILTSSRPFNPELFHLGFFYPEVPEDGLRTKN